MTEVYRKSKSDVLKWLESLPSFDVETIPTHMDASLVELETAFDRKDTTPLGRDARDTKEQTSHAVADNAEIFPDAFNANALEMGAEALSIDEDEPSGTIGIIKKLPNIVEYEKFVKESSAYQWLLSMIKRSCLLRIPGQLDAMAGIRGSISEVVFSEPTFRRVSRETNPPVIEMSITLDWDLRDFVKDQEYGVRAEEALDRAICLTGTWQEAQAMTPANYLKQTWPLVYKPFYNLMKDFLASESQTSDCEFQF